MTEKNFENFVIRPIRENDLDNLIDLAADAGPGLTTLPNDRTFLKQRIVDSLRAFDDKVSKPRGEAYLFVLEDLESKQIVGTSGIISKVGGFEPFYTYQILEEHHQDQSLGVNKTIQYLKLIENHSGPSEIGSLFLKDDYRKFGLGKLLSLCRFLFMSTFPNRFDQHVISELRGVVKEDGKSPFWDSVGQHFFDTDYSRADMFSGLGHKEFIKNLMPKHPIYIPLLPEAVQKVIGEVHDRTRPARALLEKEGFLFSGDVDIFDAGPTFKSDLNQIKTVSQSKTAKIQINQPTNTGKLALVANQSLDFRCQVVKVDDTKDELIINQDTAKNLMLNQGDSARYRIL